MSRMCNPYTLVILIFVSWILINRTYGRFSNVSISSFNSPSLQYSSVSFIRTKRETRHKIPLSPVQAYRNRLKLLPTRDLVNHDRESRETTERPESYVSSSARPTRQPSTTLSPRNYLPLPPPPPEVMADVPNGITAPITEYLMRTPINAIDSNEVVGSGLRSTGGSRHPRFLHGMSEENAYIYYPNNHRIPTNVHEGNIIEENSINDDKLKDNEYSRVVRVRGRARRIKVTRRPSLIPIVIEEDVTTPIPYNPLINPLTGDSSVYDDSNSVHSNLVDTSSGSRSIYTTPTLESYNRKDRRDHIHKCLLSDYQTAQFKDAAKLDTGQSDSDWIQSELESTCKVYIDKIEELRSQCWSALSDLRAKKYLTPSEDRSNWWKNLPFGK